MKYKAPRGTQDILPSQAGEWQAFEDSTRRILSRYGYREIRTPIFESKELFLRTVGQDTDIVQKEMYCFRDRKDREFALRPEGTASVIRSYIENALWVERPFQKLYYLGPMFRYDRPQKGRYRQFHQVGAEAVGSLSPLVDAEVIALMGELVKAAGVKKTILKLNSLGDKESRRAYIPALREYFADKEKELCPDCQRRLETNPLRILDCKVPSCGDLARNIPPTEDWLSKESREHYAAVQEWLGIIGVAFEKDKRLVRGLDYYTRTTFEYHHGGLGATVALGGGGRYDSLVAECGGPDTPAIGFSLGTERVLLAASQDRETGGMGDSRTRELAIYLAWLGEEALATAFKLAFSLRPLIRVEMELESRSLKAQFRQADKLNVSHVLILGQDELARNEVQIKEMATGRQENVRIGDLEERIKAGIRNFTIDRIPEKTQ
jgi:histidyl-tRNA synthetase